MLRFVHCSSDQETVRCFVHYYCTQFQGLLADNVVHDCGGKGARWLWARCFCKFLFVGFLTTSQVKVIPCTPSFCWLEATRWPAGRAVAAQTCHMISVSLTSAPRSVGTMLLYSTNWLGLGKHYYQCYRCADSKHITSQKRTCCPCRCVCLFHFIFNSTVSFFFSLSSFLLHFSILKGKQDPHDHKHAASQSLHC
jgi:hypothetical protein